MGIISFWNEWKQRNGKKPPELIYRCTSEFAECNILQMHLTPPPQSSSFHVLSTIWIHTFLDDEAATAITSDVSWVKISLTLTNTFLLSWVGWFHLNISISIPLHMVRMFIRIHLNWLVSYYRRTPALFDFAFAHSVRFLCFCYKCSVVCFLFLFILFSSIMISFKSFADTHQTDMCQLIRFIWCFCGGFFVSKRVCTFRLCLSSSLD